MDDKLTLRLDGAKQTVLVQSSTPLAQDIFVVFVPSPQFMLLGITRNWLNSVADDWKPSENQSQFSLTKEGFLTEPRLVSEVYDLLRQYAVTTKHTTNDFQILIQDADRHRIFIDVKGYIYDGNQNYYLKQAAFEQLKNLLAKASIKTNKKISRSK